MTYDPAAPKFHLFSLLCFPALVYLLHHVLMLSNEVFKIQIASHPNIYVLDTPGVLPPMMLDEDMCSKLALTGEIIN